MSSAATKRQLREALGFDTDAALALFFGISPSAVSQWGEDVPVPQLRFLQARILRPNLLISSPPEENGDDVSRSAVDAESAKRHECDRQVPGGPHTPDARTPPVVRA